MLRVKRIFAAGFLLFSFLRLWLGDPLAAQARDLKLDDLAAKLLASASGKISGYGEPANVKCVVVDFQEDDGTPARLGVRLADGFSKALAQKASGITVLDRRTLQGDVALAAYGGPQRVLERRAVSYAESVGAEIVVMGNIRKQRDALVVNVLLLDATGERVAEAIQRVERTQGLRELERLPPRENPPAENSTPITLPALQAAPAREVATAREPAPIGPWPDVPEYGRNASGAPHCISCPQPEYSEVARRSNTEGVVLLELLIGADGSVRDVVVERGLPDGLTEQAVYTAKRWRFKPILGPDGKAMAVKLRVEVNFKLLHK
jgi:TonB family protein